MSLRAEGLSGVSKSMEKKHTLQVQSNPYKVGDKLEMSNGDIVEIKEINYKEVTYERDLSGKGSSFSFFNTAAFFKDIKGGEE
jgi:hypothetical protein